MIKGCQKKIIHLKNTNSPYFEEAYFVLKSSSDGNANENDMLKEAVRIAESTCVFANATKKNVIPSIKKALPLILSLCASTLGLATLITVILLLT